MPDFGTPITIRHLLYHTSGLRGEWNLLELAGWGREDVITQRTLVDLLERQRKLNFEPGKKYLYCSTNYTLLAEIVAQASEMSFAEFTKQRIFDPLGMKNTHFHDDPKMIVPNRVYSYEPAGKGRYKIAQLNHGSVGARNLYTTLEDFAKWDQNFYDAKVGGSKLIDKMHVRGQLANGEELDYAAGLKHGGYAGLRTIGHSGSNAGYRSLYTRFPDQRFSIVLFGNVNTASELFRRVTPRIIDLYLADALRASLEDYVGDFHSEELGVIYSISVRPGSRPRLVVRHRGQDTVLEFEDPVRQVHRPRRRLRIRLPTQFGRHGGRTADQFRQS